MLSNIRVSVILTSFNHEKYLKEAIDSVLNQTFADFELIIWDDASSDHSWEIITSYKDPRIKAYQNKTQKRAVWGINKAILEITIGEYIAIHHSDDVWEPDKLGKQVAFLDSHQEVGAVFTWAKIIDENGNSFQGQDHFYYKIFEQPDRNRHEWLNYFFYYGNALCHPSVLIRKQCYHDMGVYRLGMVQSADFDMWVRLCMRYEIKVMPEKLVQFRVRAGEANMSGDRPDVHVRARFLYLQILQHYLDIQDPIDFQKIFPESARCFQEDEYDIGFSLAMVAIDSPFEFSHLIGLQLLFELFDNPVRAELAKRVYDFTINDFVRLSAELDVFSVLQKQIALQVQVQLAERDAQLAERDIQLAERDIQLAERDAQLDLIYASKGWKLVQYLHKIHSWFLPSGKG